MKVSFFHQHVDKRMAVVVAGPVTNYLFAIVVLALLFMFQGQPFSPANISSVLENSAAAKAGLMAGDHIIAIDNYAVDRFEDIKRIVALNAGTAIPIDLDRAGTPMQFELTPEIVTMKDRFGGEHKISAIGIPTDKLNVMETIN
jgi:regulator of sigma E protease